jgi:hypothetical protein
MRRLGIAGAGLALTVLAPTTALAQPSPVTQQATRLPFGVGGPSVVGHGVRAVCAPGSTGSYAAVGCHALALTSNMVSTSPLSSASPVGFGPADLAKAYSLPPADQGSHGTIGIVEVGYYPQLESDLAAYRAEFKLPPCTSKGGCLRIVGKTGGVVPGKPPTKALRDVALNYSVEAAVDVDAASAGCPACKIVVVYVGLTGKPRTFDEFGADLSMATNTAIRLGSSAVSLSYSVPTSLFLMSGWRAAAFSHPGVPITIASGDFGFTPFYSQWPQVLPTVIDVGGTSLYPAANTRGFTEVAWKGAGTGCSPMHAVGQQPSAVTAQCEGHRAIADISAVADPSTGYAVYDSAVVPTQNATPWLTIGETSASSPLIASLYARAGHTASVNGPSGIYFAPASAFHDITAGSTAWPPAYCSNRPVCVAGKGWDGPTGRGTPKGLAAFS